VAQRSGVDREATGRENLVLQGRLHRLGGRRLKSLTRTTRSVRSIMGFLSVVRHAERERALHLVADD
jgi:hypothetical protein